MFHALLVEDDQPALHALATFVEGQGFSTHTASNLEEARACLRQMEVDVVLLDVFLPEGSGIDLLVEIPAELRPEVVLMSGDHTLGSALESLPMQDLHFLPKPLDLEVLARTLAGVRRRNARGRAVRRGDAAARGVARLLGTSSAIARLRTLVRKVAPTDLATYVEGESGTGKELVARAIHEMSARRDKPFVAINCGALPENLIDSELFGYEKGAFTGAERRSAGLFEKAEGGTVFLDEVAEMPIELQVRLLRALEEGAIRRIGSSDEIPVDVRVVSATNRPVDAAIQDGHLREDLFHRLCVFPIATPALRDRREDILLLADCFLSELTEGRSDVTLTPQTRQVLLDYAWPGNVRQLRNAMQRIRVLAEGEAGPDTLPDQILAAFPNGLPEPGPEALAAPQVESQAGLNPGPATGDGAGGRLDPASDDGRPLPAPSEPPADGASGIHIEVGTSIADAERRLIERTLDHHGGDKKATADVLGVSLRTLYNRLNEYGNASDGEDPVDHSSTA